MDRNGFVYFNTRLSPENSGKAASYAQAIRILDAVLMHQHVVDLHGRSLYDIHDLAVLEQVWELVKEEVKKMKDNAFDKGLITFSPDDYTVRLSSALREYESQEYYDRNFGCIAGRPMTMPVEFKPSKDFLAYHRGHVFIG